MTRKIWTTVAVIGLLGGLSLYLNRDWFASESIQIFDRSRPTRPFPGRKQRVEQPTIMPLTFGFSHPLNLTVVKVIPLSDIATNKFPHPIWHLVSDSNSVPVKDFMYGVPIRGMRPSIKGATPYNLTPGEKYRLFVEAGEFKGEHDFTPKPPTP